MAQANIPTTIIYDSGVAAVMERVDIVLVGAEGVMENGGVVNKVGFFDTLQYTLLMYHDDFRLELASSAFVPRSQTSPFTSLWNHTSLLACIL